MSKKALDLMNKVASAMGSPKNNSKNKAIHAVEDEHSEAHAGPADPDMDGDQHCPHCGQPMPMQAHAPKSGLKPPMPKL